MSNLITDLQNVKASLLTGMAWVDQALETLGNPQPQTGETPPSDVHVKARAVAKKTGRKLSAAGRAAISAAAKKRWSKHRRATKAAGK